MHLLFFWWPVRRYTPWCRDMGENNTLLPKGGKKVKGERRKSCDLNIKKAEYTWIMGNNRIDPQHIWCQRYWPKFSCSVASLYIRRSWKRNLRNALSPLPCGTLRMLSANLFLCLLLYLPHPSVCSRPRKESEPVTAHKSSPGWSFWWQPREEKGGEKKIRKISISEPLLFSLIMRGAVTPSLFFRRRSIIRSI